MRLRRPWTDENAFASLVGILLLVAVLVIVAATVAVVAFGFGESVTEVAPSASIAIQEDNFGDGVPRNDSLTFVHRAGDTLDRSRLEIRIDGVPVYNDTSDSESNSDTNEVRGLIVEVDDDEFNDLNKPGRLSPADTVGGPPGDADGSDPGVVLEWEAEVRAGQRLVVQERNATKAADVIQPGDRVVVVWRGEETSAIITESTVAPEYAP
ncbi:type IV pilin [Halorientalis marina]|uniref:type IV pilin n=1 Tax=Halorientalis marina TaxID=2931976 RepID=UPI001FF3C38A|nr:type IV pilin [Halorientalis marina]